ncbi:SPOR domain-containing protein [Fodinicurvata fenggangensis]|uniref:SPOR domain-containing protein n=1 Tax=Fodinicurvata fenggangensis TaxID=1121830 RepID=UPI00047EBAE4|nr:SPOR domain-containing protein [Fodinicurvata fenggangensis]
MTYDPRFSWNNEGSPGELQGEQRPPRKPKGGGQGPRRLIPAVVAVLGLLLFAGIVWYAYSWGRSDGASEAIPVVQAPEGPEKEAPENPGGMEVPYQDTLVLNPGNGQDKGQEVERLLPPPEEPVEREQAEPSEAPADEETAELDTTREDVLPEPTAEEAEETGAASEESSDMEVADTNDSPQEAQELTAESDGEAEPSEEGGTEETEPETEATTAEEAAATDATETADSSQAVAEAFRIQLAAVRSTEAAEAEWQRLQGKHEALLGSLTLNIERADLGDQGVYYRIQAGPLSDKQAAETLCEDLKSRDQACLVRSPQ